MSSNPIRPKQLNTKIKRIVSQKDIKFVEKKLFVTTYMKKRCSLLLLKFQILILYDLI